MGIAVPPDGISLRLNLCAIKETDGTRIILSHNGGGIHGEEAEALMRDLTRAGSPFAQKMREYMLEVYPTDTFRHIGVMKAGAVDLSQLTLMEPHNVLDQAIDAYLPKHTGDDAGARRMADAIRDLMEVSYQVLKDHPVNRARAEQCMLPANMIWPWGAATVMTLDSFEQKYHKRGSVVSAVPLVWGIASLGGLKTPRVEGANGDLDTNYRGKVQAALSALESGDDFAAVHIEAPDEMAHAGELIKKMRAIQNVNDLVLRPILEALGEGGEDFRVLLMCDHPTLLTPARTTRRPCPMRFLTAANPRRPASTARQARSPTPCWRMAPSCWKGCLLMDKLRRFVWYLASRLLIVLVLLAFAVVTFYYAMNATNISVVLKDGMALRAQVIMMDEDPTELTKFFQPSYLQRDEYLVQAGNGESPYLIYTVRGIDHRLQLTWMWCWPWDTTAKAEFIERIPRIDGRIDRTYEETAIALYGENNYESPPRWPSARYTATLVKENDQWHIRSIQLQERLND